MERLLNVIDADYEGRLEYAIQLAAQFSQNRGLVGEILSLWLDWWRDLLLVKVGCVDAVTNTDRLAMLTSWAEGYSLVQMKGFINSLQATGEQLKQNANPQLVFEVLMLSMPGRGR
jgi:hypothetical protein